MTSSGRRRIPGLVLLLLTLGRLEAQEELFDDPDALEATAPTPVVDSQQNRFLEAGTKLGGRFWATLTSSWLTEPGERLPEGSLTTDLGADLSFDARPSQDYRVFGKVRGTAPFDDPEVRELFADVQLTPGLGVRIGKQNLKSGVGYFFSPADSLSLASLNPNDPEAEREGPVALKAGMALGTTNFTTVVLIQEADHPEDVGGYGQIEGVWGDWEWGAGTFVQRDRAPKVMATLTGSLGSVQSFSELTVSRGSDRHFVAEASGGSPGLRVYQDRSSLFLSWTTGVKVSEDEHNLSLTVQVYYNGEGYDDDELLGPAGQMARQGLLLPSDLAFWGRYQGALKATAQDLGGSGVSVSVQGLSAAYPASGTITPGVSYSWEDHAEVLLTAPWAWGEAGSEYAPEGRRWGVSVEVKLGAGSF